MNNNKRDELRRVLKSLIGIKGKKGVSSASPDRLRNAASRLTQDRHRVIPEEEYYSDRVDYVVNPPPLSAERLMSQAAFRVDTPNYF